MKNVSLKLPEELYSHLESVMADRGLNRSAIVREALELYFAALLKPDANSYLSQASDLCGVVDGPEDLSTNPDHMEGFGE